MRSITKAMNHTISIKNLGPIKEIKNFEVKNINAVIGESATGKSLLAKVVFAFSETSFIYSLLEEDQNNLTLSFAGLFESYKNYNIDYNYGNNLIIYINNRDGETEITLSGELKEAIALGIKEKKRDLDLLIGHTSNPKDITKEEKDYFGKVFFLQYFTAAAGFPKFKNKFLAKIDALMPIFIPATRSFVSDFDNLRLDYMSSPKFSQEGKMSQGDKTLIHFSGVYRGFLKGFSNLTHPLIRGSISKIEGNTLKFSDKDNNQILDFSEISSGQKALFPMLMILQEIEKRNEPYLIIIEEPEAHIFPKDQKLILDRIIEVANKTKSKILLTTHSPYILMAMNNLIEANTRQYEKLSDKYIDFDEINIQHLADGKSKNILDEEEKLINLDHIEKIEDEIVDEFQKILSTNDAK